ncbi:MAG: four helix bundle protein [Selenomonadaceae bacterium]|nr:four helix bundle protein [Selenomonadaceae bacterium]
MKKANPILDKSKSFAIRIVNLYNYLKADKSEYVMSKQLFRSGTSIGANVRESVYAQLRADFLSKMYNLTPAQAKSIYDDCNELIKILSSITNTTKNS